MDRSSGGNRIEFCRNPIALSIFIHTIGNHSSFISIKQCKVSIIQPEGVTGCVRTPKVWIVVLVDFLICANDCYYIICSIIDNTCHCFIHTGCFVQFECCIHLLCTSRIVGKRYGFSNLISVDIQYIHRIAAAIDHICFGKTCNFIGCIGDQVSSRRMGDKTHILDIDYDYLIRCFVSKKCFCDFSSRAWRRG